MLQPHEKEVSLIVSKLSEEVPELSEIKSPKAKPDEEKRSTFCCQQAMFYRPRITNHEDLFTSYLKYEKDHQLPEPTRDDERGLQVVRQKNFGPIEEKRYFSLPGFQEKSEEDFQKEGYERLNSFKNLKCDKHNLFYELNAYRKLSAISHHHTSTVSGSHYVRDSSKIDFNFGSDKGFWKR